MQGDKTVRPLQESDIVAVAAMLGRAFLDDPLQQWAFPDPQERARVLPELFALQVRYASFPLGACWCSPGLECAALWAPPGRWIADAAAQAAMAPMASIVGPALGRMRIAYTEMTEAHPMEPLHWYLQGVGTDPSHQRQGYARRVLAPVLAQCDTDATPAYLEATKERNVGIYESMGFRVLRTLVLPDDGPTLWTMWRDPQTRG